MNQKLFLLIVLIAGLAACTKDDGDDISKNKSEIETDSSIGMQLGEFEGDWILNQKKIETDTLTVLEQTVVVKLPSEPLLRYVVRTIPNVIDDLRFEVSPNLRHIFRYELQGYSENKSYSSLLPKDQSYSNLYYLYDGSNNLIIPTTYLVASGTMYYDIGNNEEVKHGYYSVLTDKPMLAIFDRDTRLWTLKITLNKLRIIKEGDTNEIIWDLSSPIELLFVATKKIKGY